MKGINVYHPYEYHSFIRPFISSGFKEKSEFYISFALGKHDALLWCNFLSANTRFATLCGIKVKPAVCLSCKHLGLKKY